MSRASVAAGVRMSKQAHPERYCANSGCLWRVVSGRTGEATPCPRHPVIALVPAKGQLARFDVTRVAPTGTEEPSRFMVTVNVSVTAESASVAKDMIASQIDADASCVHYMIVDAEPLP